MSALELKTTASVSRDFSLSSVLVIESPSATDFYEGTSEGKLLCEALRTSGIPYVYRVAVDVRHFEKAVTLGALELWQESQRLPIVHVSAHGTGDGLSLTDETIVDWSHLGTLLKAANVTFGGKLLVCMSACHGLRAASMIKAGDDELPFFALVGPREEPTWAQAAVGFVTLYHLLVHVGKPLPEAVAGMRVASGTDSFDLVEGATYLAVANSIPAMTALADSTREEWAPLIGHLGAEIRATSDSLLPVIEKYNRETAPVVAKAMAEFRRIAASVDWDQLHRAARMLPPIVPPDDDDGS